jgi:hypothetical protein
VAAVEEEVAVVAAVVLLLRLFRRGVLPLCRWLSSGVWQIILLVTNNGCWHLRQTYCMSEPRNGGMMYTAAVSGCINLIRNGLDNVVAARRRTSVSCRHSFHVPPQK